MFVMKYRSLVLLLSYTYSIWYKKKSEKHDMFSPKPNTVMITNIDRAALYNNNQYNTSQLIIKIQ